MGRLPDVPLTDEHRTNISIGMEIYHSKRTPEEIEERREHLRMCAYISAANRKARGESSGRPFEKGNDMTTPAGNALIAPGRKFGASVKRHLAEIATNNPELIREALVEGLLAEAPKS